MENQIQKFAYEIVNHTVTIWRCFSQADVAEIPKEIDGYPVTRIAPYTFSAHMNEKELNLKNYTSMEELPALCGDRLTAIYIPDTVAQVGRYCFYNCSQLELISFTDTLRDWGSGAFTGCHSIQRLELYLYGDGRSGLKDILSELPELTVVDYYRVKEEKKEQARLIFPEFYEEGVENTPARLINYTVHGSGMRFRNCFQQRVFSFFEYDSKFEYAGFQEDFPVVAALAEGRLRYPMELSEKARLRYEQFVCEQKESFADYIVEKKDTESLNWLVQFISAQEKISQEERAELLGRMTQRALEVGFSEAVGILMDAGQGKKRKRKSFEL